MAVMLRSNTNQWANHTGIKPTSISEVSRIARREQARRRQLRRLLMQRIAEAGRLSLRGLFVVMSGLLLLYGASTVLATTDLFWVRFVTLMIWACGFLPICYGLWCLNVHSLKVPSLKAARWRKASWIFRW